MKLKNFNWYRNLIGGVWKQYAWFDLKGEEIKEWRKVHNGKWCEYEIN